MEQRGLVGRRAMCLECANDALELDSNDMFVVAREPGWQAGYKPLRHRIAAKYIVTYPCVEYQEGR